MQPEQWDKLKSIWSRIVDLPRDQRAQYLDEACAGDADVKAEIESLLAASEKLDVAHPTESFEESPGTMIGPYKLLELIGEGGFGLVYLAEQQHPVVRKVALKIIKLGMDTRAVIARFEAERQALAMMDHPNIARVLDAGALRQAQGTLGEQLESKGALREVLGAGRPYFVMELVKGIPITEYCDQNNLTIRQRLELLVPVCQAVQHAHQKGIIHRDIKPSNVLVCLHDGKPVPKVIDFGIAKAINQRLTEKTLFTEFKQMIGTPAYMSPEQAEFSDLNVDTRSDIYSLGVLMYELLTGVTPFDERTLRSAAYAEMQRIIREVEPPKPSTRLSTLDTLPSVAACRSVEPAKLTRSIRGELDWIVMKCLEKDRTRRYATAETLGADITRYLSDQPVTAGPASRWYRVQKVVRRHKAGVAASAAMVILLLTGITATTWQAIRATRAQTQAEQRRVEAETIARFMENTLSGVGPSVAVGRDMTVIKEMMDDAAGRIQSGELQMAPAAELRLRVTVGDIYREIAEFEMARQMLEPAAELARSMSDAFLPALPNANLALAELRQDTGDSEQAQQLALEALHMYQRVFSGDHQDLARSLNDLASYLEALGRADEALPKYRAALEMRRRLFPRDHPVVAEALNNLGNCLRRLGKDGEALPELQASVEMQQRLHRGDHPSVALGLSNLAVCLWSMGRSNQALPMHEAALEMKRRLFKTDHPEVANSLNNVAVCLLSLGRLQEALPNMQAALEMRQRLFKGDHPDVAMALSNVGSCLRRLARFDQALSNSRSALEMYQRLYPGDHPDVAWSMHNVAGCLEAMGRYDEALPMCRAAMEMRRRILAPDHPNVARSEICLGRVLLRLNRIAESEPVLLAAYERLKDNPAVAASLRREPVELLIDLYDAWKEPDEAAKWRGTLEQFDRQHPRSTQPSTQPTTAPS